MFLKIYAICWLILMIVGLGTIGAQLVNPFVDKKQALGNLIGALLTVPMNICAFLYIFK